MNLLKFGILSVHRSTFVSFSDPWVVRDGSNYSELGRFKKDIQVSFACLRENQAATSNQRPRIDPPFQGQLRSNFRRTPLSVIVNVMNGYSLLPIITFPLTSMPSWSVIFVAIVIAVLCVAGYVFAPKGDNQTF